ncbi:hypothetical protein M9Y10_028117 [Tritrichomonas musculus]|uniref:TPR Domain containing protein n=1 Tax=Tritrichomonas musculus TaxID=1915356 RepID=A0ABR2KII3_9EUKA
MYIYTPKQPRKKVELQLAPPNLPYKVTDVEEINDHANNPPPLPQMTNQLSFLTPEEIYQIGKSFYKELHTIDDLDQAFLYFRTAAEMGYPPAQNKYAYCIDQVLNPSSAKSPLFRNYKLSSTKSNQEEMIRYYTLAANQNHKRALNNLGVCYIQGNGVTPNPEKALELLKRSKELGDRLGTINYDSFSKNYQTPQKGLAVKYG